MGSVPIRLSLLIVETNSDMVIVHWVSAKEAVAKSHMVLVKENGDDPKAGVGSQHVQIRRHLHAKHVRIDSKLGPSHHLPPQQALVQVLAHAGVALQCYFLPSSFAELPDRVKK